MVWTGEDEPRVAHGFSWQWIEQRGSQGMFNAGPDCCHSAAVLREKSSPVFLRAGEIQPFIPGNKGSSQQLSQARCGCVWEPGNSFQSPTVHFRTDEIISELRNSSQSPWIHLRAQQLISEPMNSFQSPWIHLGTHFRTHEFISEPMNSFQTQEFISEPINSFQDPWIHFRTHFWAHEFISGSMNPSQNTFQSPGIRFRAQEFIREPSGRVFSVTLSAQGDWSRALSELNPGKGFETVFAGYRSPSFPPFFQGNPGWESSFPSPQFSNPK